MADPLKVLLEGIEDKWAAESALMYLNGLYLHEKPPDQAVGFPYYVLAADDSELYGYTDVSEIWTHMVEIRAYHRTPELAAAAIEVVQAIFDAKAFSLSLSSSHTFISSRRIRGGFNNTGKEVERAVARYQMRTNRPRA